MGGRGKKREVKTWRGKRYRYGERNVRDIEGEEREREGKGREEERDR